MPLEDKSPESIRVLLIEAAKANRELSMALWDKLPLKHQQYILHKAQGLTKKDAKRAAGFQRMEKSPETKDVKLIFREVMQRYITPQDIAETIKGGMRAVVVKTATLDGKISDVKAFADHRTRIAAADMAATMGGYYEPKFQPAERDQLQELIDQFRLIHAQEPDDKS